MTLADASAFSVFAAAAAHFHRIGASEKDEADTITLIARRENEEPRPMKLAINHAMRVWPENMQGLPPLTARQFGLIAFFVHPMIKFLMILVVDEATSTATVVSYRAFLNREEDFWPFLTTEQQIATVTPTNTHR